MLRLQPVAIVRELFVQSNILHCCVTCRSKLLKYTGQRHSAGK